MHHSIPGFNGERPDPVTDTVNLGKGYRAYSTVLKRFNSPDNMSPFGPGGINAYAYCAGDPLNYADPSGHLSPGQWIGMAIGFVAGIALSIVTEGTALPTVLSLMGTVAADAGAGAASELVTEAVDSHRIHWGQVGIAAGLSAVMSLSGFGLRKFGTPLSTEGLASPSGTVAPGIRKVSQLGYTPTLETISEHPWEINSLSLRAKVTVPQNVYTLGVTTSHYDILCYAFEGLPGNERHLDILVHGSTTYGAVDINDTALSSTGLLALLKKNVPRFHERYTSVSLLSCNSGAVAPQLAKLTGKQIIGYTGKVFYSQSLKLSNLMDVEALTRHMFNGQIEDLTNLYLHSELPELTEQEREIELVFPGGALAYFP